MGLSRALADTSVFIALECGRPLDREAIPEELLVCVVTMAELEMGVLTAPDVATRSQRLRTVQGVAALRPMPIDSRCATTWARLRATLSQSGRRMGVNDLWIASCAAALGLPVVTQDDGFDVLAELGLLEVVKV